MGECVENEAVVRLGLFHCSVSTTSRNCFSGGHDHLVKVWDYNEGEVTHVGVGHSGNIMGIRVSPGNQYIVSVSADGAILRWKYPFAS